ncbi:hypothetical protein TRICI_004358 [Trichomonascus ciferrii]|uniref:Uncharacterized protein n=1 Tax=Trichomonascus ciferrii TaxID=44093 RepID=A0A642V160_9ASCO|nr:hypothetical protein TRICI_004358 [Trichomonascus ciferrii]
MKVTTAIVENSKLSNILSNNVPRGQKKERKKLKKVSPNLELPILLNTKKGLQAMAEFITTGRKHGTAKLEVCQINQSGSRQLEATQTTSQQAGYSKSVSD